MDINIKTIVQALAQYKPEYSEDQFTIYCQFCDMECSVADFCTIDNFEHALDCPVLLAREILAAQPEPSEPGAYKQARGFAKDLGGAVPETESQFFLFCYNDFYPNGGAADCKGIFTDLEAAKTAGAALAREFEEIYIEQPHNGEFLEVLCWTGKEWVFRG